MEAFNSWRQVFAEIFSDIDELYLSPFLSLWMFIQVYEDEEEL